MDNPAGLPRPLADLNGKLRPVPWTQREAEWGSSDTGKIERCWMFSICLLCGKHVQKGRVFVTEAKQENLKGLYTFNDLGTPYILDGGPLHESCAKITRAHCQTVRQRIAEGRIFERDYLTNG